MDYLKLRNICSVLPFFKHQNSRHFCIYHDSAAVILVDGIIIAAAQEKRFTRIKHDAAFPACVTFCLRQAGLSINDLDAIAFYDKPLLKFERLLETYYGFAPAKGLFSFIKSMPVWIKEKLFLKRIIREELVKIEAFDPKISFYFQNIICHIPLVLFFLRPLKRGNHSYHRWCRAMDYRFHKPRKRQYYRTFEVIAFPTFCRFTLFRLYLFFGL